MSPGFPEVRRLQDELGELRRRLDSSPAVATGPYHAQLAAFLNSVFWGQLFSNQLFSLIIGSVWLLVVMGPAYDCAIARMCSLARARNAAIQIPIASGTRRFLITYKKLFGKTY